MAKRHVGSDELLARPDVDPERRRGAQAAARGRLGELLAEDERDRLLHEVGQLARDDLPVARDVPLEEDRGAAVERDEVARDGREAERRAAEVVDDGARQRDPLGPGVAQVAVVGERRAAAPLLGVGRESTGRSSPSRSRGSARASAGRARRTGRGAARSAGASRCAPSRPPRGASQQRVAVGGRDGGNGSRRGDGGPERRGEALGLRGRVGADPLHRDAVGARELADDARVLRVEPAAEAGAPRADQEGDPRRRLPGLRARARRGGARPPRARRARACRRRPSRSCRSARPCPTSPRRRGRRPPRGRSGSGRRSAVGRPVRPRPRSSAR